MYCVNYINLSYIHFLIICVVYLDFFFKIKKNIFNILPLCLSYFAIEGVMWCGWGGVWLFILKKRRVIGTLLWLSTRVLSASPPIATRASCAHRYSTIAPPGWLHKHTVQWGHVWRMYARCSHNIVDTDSAPSNTATAVVHAFSSIPLFSGILFGCDGSTQPVQMYTFTAFASSEMMQCSVVCPIESHHYRNPFCHPRSLRSRHQYQPSSHIHSLA